MFDAVDEVGRVAAAEAIECDYAKSGFPAVVSNEREAERVRGLLTVARRRGFDESDFRWLDLRHCNERVRVAGSLGGFYSPHGATVQPAKLVRGLACAIERRGVTLYERSPVRSVATGEVVTERGRLRARTVLLCTEGYSQHLDPDRHLLPVRWRARRRGGGKLGPVGDPYHALGTCGAARDPGARRRAGH
jgi:glycine/D-amino acid oxidase-like deaminating enzyme